MATSTMRAARALQSSFEGRITSTHDAHAEFRGKPTVLVPTSAADVERALRLARSAGRRMFVRSGNSVSTTDLRMPTAGDNAPGAVVVSMEAFRDIEAGAQQLTVGVAATTQAIAASLLETGSFLPLDAIPSQSIVSAVLSTDTSPFLRSDTGLGPLRNAVTEAEIVPVDGTDAGRARTVRGDMLRDILSGDGRAVITRLVFDTGAWTAQESQRWTQAWTTSYQPSTFAHLCDTLFDTDGEVPDDVDLAVCVTDAAYSMKLVVVRAGGHGIEDADATAAVVQSALAKAELPVLDSRRVLGPGSVATWATAGPGAAAPGEVLTRFGSNMAPRSFAGLREPFLDAVDFAIGATPTGRERAPGVRAWAELDLTPGGDVVARAEISGMAADVTIAREAHRYMSAAIPEDNASPMTPSADLALIRRGPAREMMRGVEVLPDLTPVPGFDLVRSNRAGADKIPGFKGEVFEESDGWSYRDQIRQYAVTSYPARVVADRMTPRLVAVPVDAADVARAVRYAAGEGLKVVARSGGHQYCGLSSGGSDTLLMNMHLLDKVVFSPSEGTPSQVTVGPGAALKDLSPQLRRHGVVVPHGECPLVNVGGHVQTGGVGHQLRTLGLMLDWVCSFKMVTRDPKSPDADRYIEREFTRPPDAESSTMPTDGDVFGAVLGGGPSGWGVLTEITFDLTSDGTYPTSHGYSFAYPYLGSKDGFCAAMREFATWARRQASGELPPGIDLFLSVVSGDFPRPAVLLVEAMSADRAGAQEMDAVVGAVDRAVAGWARTVAHVTSSLDGPAELSFIADHGVRTIGWLGLPASGREFDLPYKKSLHITKVPFSDDFCTQFVQLVDDAYQSAGLKVVFQGVVGGGAFLANGTKGITHMQRRDALVQLVFDVFYSPGHEADAEEFQVRMKSLLRTFSGGADVRMLWGTFEDANTGGEQLRMDRPEVQALYYDSDAEYQRLQQIKAYTDPEDVFHTTLTVQLPD